MQETEEEASTEGAFNPTTGERNWDCPCLGGMAHGPCGEQFRAAFSCFVFSEQEPKGMDCIEKFKGMQECFKDFPDVYGGELEEEDEGEEGLAQGDGGAIGGQGVAVGEKGGEGAVASDMPLGATSQKMEEGTGAAGDDTTRANKAKEQVAQQHNEPTSESDEMVPKAAHDTTSANVAT